MTKKEMQDALAYVQLGMYAFVASFFIIALGVFVLPLFLLERLLIAEPLLMIGGGSLCTFPSLLLAWLTNQKLINNHQPR